MKIGLLQTAAQTADFSNNLRAVVQGYRHCIDHGAEVVVADAFSLCGPCPGDLKERSSFLNQTQAALKALAAEIGSVPLILGTYAPDPAVQPGDDFWEDDGLLPETAPDDMEDGSVKLMPYLLEQDTVSVALDETVVLENGLSLFASCEEDIDAFGFQADLLLALPTSPWYAGCETKNEDFLSWEARQEGKPLVCVRPAGSADGNLWGGGATVHAADGRLLARLPLFEAASCVVDTARPKPVPALPGTASLLRRALTMGLADHVRRNGYEGVAVVLDGRPHALLLAALAAEALGTDHVALPAREELAPDVLDFLQKASLAGRLVLLPGSALPPIADSPDAAEGGGAGLPDARLLLAQAAHEAEKEGLMLLSSLCRSELLAGKSLELAAGSLLLPFGDLYEGDLRQLSAQMEEEGSPVFPFAELPDSSFDPAFQLLEDGNRSATELLTQPGFPIDETVLRKAQRLLIASAWKRRCMPPVLSVTAVDKRRRYPAMHRLND